jgi:hypothetical protein
MGFQAKLSGCEGKHAAQLSAADNADRAIGGED